MNNFNEYKLQQLRSMLAAETSEDAGGYGAHLDHWSGRAKPINLDAEALQVLINHYEAKDRPHTEITLHTYDLQRIVIALIDEEVEKGMKAKRAETQEAKDSFQEDADRAAKLKDVFADLNRLVREDHDWTLNITVIG